MSAIPVSDGYSRNPQNESSLSAVSWGAIVGGAFVAAALSLLLLVIGAGLGFASVSPWQNAGASAAALGIGGAIWLALMQLISAGAGGYVAGRMRTKWVGVHTDEVYFRDTVHGLFVWAVGLVITASFLASGASSVISGSTRLGAAAVSAGVGAGAAAAGGAAAGMAQNGSGLAGASDYLIDRLIRRNPTSASPAAPDAGAAGTAGAQNVQNSGNSSSNAGSAATDGDAASRTELGRIFYSGLKDGQLSPDDKAYAAQFVADRAGISQAEAGARIDDALARMKAASDEAREAADKARKAAAYLSLWIGISLLMGAFFASFAATIGGRQRDSVNG